jgi:hypothetical protein
MLSGGSRVVSVLLKKAGWSFAIAALSVVSLHAQSAAQDADAASRATEAQASSPTQVASTSADYRALLSSDLLGGPAALPAASGRGAQYGSGQYGTPGYQSRWSHLAVEGGGGFTAPLGNTSGNLTYGWNFRGGLGWEFTKKFDLMAEYEFDRSGISAAVLQQVGEPGGNVHTWSLTLDPVWNYKTKGAWGGYVVGGGGFYRQLTSFTEPVLAEGLYCSYFYCYPYYYTTNAVVSHYSSNQGGLNIGTGVTFGRLEHTRFFAEARYEWLDTPGRSTQLIPVTFGLRW